MKLKHSRPVNRSVKLDAVWDKVRNHWMVFPVAVWLFACITALISGALSKAAISGVIMLMTLDSYHRDRRKRAQGFSATRREPKADRGGR
jgi:hypothetical protein